ncbi:MAG TPA: hypothetical protein VFG49_15125 [Dyella sp.]|uniref:hypothetical protein n=1 Tax=Dyella sp. TaxID=1869338 RepID=UPI002D784447|nr:hypothetical protein [Dyella sp.]HET6554857.1 hypothetical protein [Dyella sp.]
MPRLTAHFSADDAALPGPLRQALEQVRSKTGERFNSIGLNLYWDEHDSVAMHNDRLGDLIEGRPIALLSLARRVACISAARSTTHLAGWTWISRLAACLP